jgi:hypothetical protein
MSRGSRAAENDHTHQTHIVIGLELGEAVSNTVGCTAAMRNKVSVIRPPVPIGVWRLLRDIPKSRAPAPTMAS